MEQPLIDVLDARGEVIAQATANEIRRKKLLHRVAGLIVENDQGQLLVHRHSMAADEDPGKYTIMVSETVNAGDTYLPTVVRIVRKRLRIQGEINVQPIFPYNLRSPEANINFGLFRCLHTGTLDPDPTVIGEHFFASLEDIEKLMQEKPFVHSSIEIFRRYQGGIQR